MTRIVLCACSMAALLSAQTPPQAPPPAPATQAPVTQAPASQTPATPPPAQTPAPAPPPSGVLLKKHFFIGIRGSEFPLASLSAMDNRTMLTTTTAPKEPVRDWSFVTASHSPHWSAGPTIEYVPNQNWAVSVEALYHRLHYTKVTTIAWGTDDPTTTTDERTHMFRNEDTRAALWDGALMVHYRGIRPTGLLSRMYLAAGPAVRLATNLSTSVVTTFPDTSTSTTRPATPLSKRNTLGAVAGIGFRIIDDFNIHWTPEIRYTRWAGSTFSTDSTISPRNQLEVTLGFTF